MVSDIFSRRPTFRQSWVVASGGGGFRRQDVGGGDGPPSDPVLGRSLLGSTTGSEWALTMVRLGWR